MLNQDLEEEIQFHLDARAADLEKRGMSAQAAARQARIEFGSVGRYVEEAREEKGLKAWDRLRMDLREIFRGFCRRPAFAILAVLMLSAGIGSVVLTYSMMDGLVLQPLPYGQAERLFNVRTIVPKISAQHPDLPVNARHYLEWRKRCSTCESLALIGSQVLELTGSGKPLRLEAAISSRGIISTLGLKLEAGRDIEAGDEGPGAKPVAIISHELWRNLSGGDLRLLGQTILLNRVATEVVGVLPEGFHLPRGFELGDMTRAPERVDLLMPIRADLSQTPASGNFDWAMIVKLREGTSLEAASGEFNVVLNNFSSELMKGIKVELEPLKDRLTGRLRRPLLLMACAAAVLLLIACVNLGNLFRYRSLEREQSAAIRLAIGASREDIMRQSLTEILLCSCIGGLAGLMLAWAGLRWFASIHLGEFMKPNAISMSSFVAVAGIAVSLIAGLVSGAPALRRLWRCGALGLPGKEKQWGTQTRPERLARQVLISIESGLSFVLAVFAGLLLLSYLNVKSADHGFAAEHAFTFEAATNGSHEELLTVLRRMDGVAAVGLTNSLPLQGESCVRQIERVGAAKSSELSTANGRYISPGYFEAAGALILSGRGFSEADRKSPVIVLSEGASRRIFGTQNPVGEFIRYGKEVGKQGYKVVGVVADQRTTTLEAEAGATAYLPYWEWKNNNATFVVRSNLSEADAMEELQHLAKSLEEKVAMGPIHHLRQIFDKSIAWRKVQTVFTATFALLGILMASLGIIAMASEMLARRKGEIAVRMALGATREEIVRLMLWESIRPVLVGLLGGAAIVLVAGSLLEPQMYQVSVRNPWILCGLSAAILMVAVLFIHGTAVRSVNSGPAQDMRLG
jgi:putative ABC transport system permease protein